MPHWPIPLGHKPIDLGLERVRELLGRLGNPERRLPPVVHIAGTNGKGSTLAYIKAIMEASGYRVHRYTSPHLVYFNERIELAGKPIEDDVLYDVLERCRVASKDLSITFFEGTTIAALLAFAETPADIVLLETGMGGRLDATNVIDQPALNIITPISMDHAEFFGDSLLKIAGEKAAIMRKDVPCISAVQHPDVADLLAGHAGDVGAKLTFADGVQLPCPPALQGQHQIMNAKAAVAGVQALAGFNISTEHYVKGLQGVSWPGRLQPLSLYGRDVWLDGGHNEDAARAMAAWLKDKPPVALVVGMLGNKDLDAFLRVLKPYVTQLVAVPIPEAPDAFFPEKIMSKAEQLDIKSTCAASLKEAVLQASDPILIAGSLYLVGMALAESHEVPYNQLI